MLFIKEKSHTLTPAGTIGTHSLTVAELPAHTHGRGTQDIVGEVSACDMGSIETPTGAFYQVTRWGKTIGGGSDGYDIRFGFKASKKWTGASESKGSGTAHGHTWTGTSVTINNNPPYKVAYCFIRIS